MSGKSEKKCPAENLKGRDVPRRLAKRRLGPAANTWGVNDNQLPSVKIDTRQIETKLTQMKDPVDVFLSWKYFFENFRC